MRRRDSGDMANAIGETRAVARQGSSQHDEMDGCARWWVWMGFRVGHVAKTDEACTCMLQHSEHCIWTGWNRQDKKQELGGWAPQAPCWPWHRLTRERAGVDTP